MSDQTRFMLSESDLPKAWYNINADSPVPPTPVLHPGTMEPVTPDFLSVLLAQQMPNYFAPPKGKCALLLLVSLKSRVLEFIQSVQEIGRARRVPPATRKPAQH